MNKIIYRPAEMSDLPEISRLVSSAVLEMEKKRNTSMGRDLSHSRRFF
ncbi:MAG: hypothetical protein ACI4RH_13700 [Huintestinicola sp.]